MTALPLRAALLAGLCSLAGATELPAQDTVPGAKDHPLLSRYAGSRLVGYLAKKYDETTLVAGPCTQPPGAGPKFDRLVTAEGRITRIAYNYAQDRSAVEVMRNYRSAMKAAGMTTVFSCDKEACGGTDFGSEFESLKIGEQTILFMGDGQQTAPFNNGRLEPHYLLASARRADGAVTYAAVYVVPPLQGENGGVFVEIVEPEVMETGKVAVDLSAEQMGRGLAQDGKVALYGLYFDTDKADVRADSRPTLDEMAKLLRQDASLNVYIVGHTDNHGTYAHNLELSQHRADAVVKALAGDYKIDPRRLVAKGVASIAPVASNDSDAGRAKNRRVEMVKQ
jgi:OOP family OmpA-OmpF porin